MKTIEITNIELFQLFTEVQIENSYIDLHNEYECIKIFYHSHKKRLVFVFENIENRIKKVFLWFTKCEILNTQHLFFDMQNALTLDNLHRGKFLQNNECLTEETFDKKKCFYLEFLEGQFFEVLSQKVFLKNV